MTTIIKVAGHDYRIGRLDAVKQFHVARRIGPMLAIMGTVAANLSRGIDQVPVDDFIPLLGPVSEVLARMSDDDANYVLFECLGVVHRVVSDRGAPVTAGGKLMFEDLDMVAMMRLVAEVIRENLGGFMKGLGEEAPSPSS